MQYQRIEVGSVHIIGTSLDDISPKRVDDKILVIELGLMIVQTYQVKALVYRNCVSI